MSVSVSTERSLNAAGRDLVRAAGAARTDSTATGITCDGERVAVILPAGDRVPGRGELDTLKNHLTARARAAFKPDAQPAEADLLGRLLSDLLHWDGDGILAVAAAALTEANMHDEARAVRGLTAEGGTTGTGLFTLAPAGPAWAARETGGHAGAPPFLRCESIAQMINDAVDARMITGGPPGAVLMADCTADNAGCPDGWRVLLRLPGLGCLLAGETSQPAGDTPSGEDLLQGAITDANQILAAWQSAAGPSPGVTGYPPERTPL